MKYLWWLLLFVGCSCDMLCPNGAGMPPCCADGTTAKTGCCPEGYVKDYTKAGAMFCRKYLFEGKANE